MRACPVRTSFLRRGGAPDKSARPTRCRIPRRRRQARDVFTKLIGAPRRVVRMSQSRLGHDIVTEGWSRGERSGRRSAAPRGGIRNDVRRRGRSNDTVTHHPRQQSAAVRSLYIPNVGDAETSRLWSCDRKEGDRNAQASCHGAARGALFVSASAAFAQDSTGRVQSAGGQATQPAPFPLPLQPFVSISLTW